MVAKFATGVVDTGGKFAACVVDTGGNLPPVTLTPVANLSQLPSKLGRKPCWVACLL
jgi:hypothetical protein